MNFFKKQVNRFKKNPIKESVKTVALGIGGKIIYDTIEDAVNKAKADKIMKLYKEGKFKSKPIQDLKPGDWIIQNGRPVKVLRVEKV